MTHQEKTLRDLAAQFGIAFETELDAFIARRRRQYEAFYFDYVLREKIVKAAEDSLLHRRINQLIDQEATFVERPSFGWSKSIEAAWMVLHEKIVQRLRLAGDARLQDGDLEQKLAELVERGRKQRDHIVYQYGELLDSFEECAELKAKDHPVKAQKLSYRSFDDIKQVFRTVLDHGPSLTLAHS